MASGPRWLSSRMVRAAKPDGQECSAWMKRADCTVSRVAAAICCITHTVILRLPPGFLRDSAVQDRRLRVHLFDTGASPPTLLAHTCGDAPCIANARSFQTPRPAVIPAVTQPVASPPMYAQQPTAYAVQPPSPYGYAPAPMMPVTAPPQSTSAYSMQALQAGMANMRMDADPAAMAAFQVQAARMAQYAQQIPLQQPRVHNRVQSQVQGPVYVSSPTGTHVNVGQGAIKTEVRGVFVSNIDFKASSRELQRFFSRAGEIVHCQLQRDPATGKSKGNATVQYAAANDAKNAVRLFHNEKYMGMRLKVRLDKEPVAIGVPSASSSRSNGAATTARPTQQSRNNTEPIIVNGSVCQK
jgi:hypothetical protein